MRRVVLGVVSLVLTVPVVAVAPSGRAHAASLAHPVAPSVQRLTARLAPAAVPAGPADPAGSGSALSAVLFAHRFSLVGASWPAGALPVDAVVQVRTRAPNRAWSGWTDLGAEDAAPDQGSADAVSAAPQHLVHASPLWTGSATEVQVRSTGSRSLAAVTLDLVDPGTSAGDATPAAVVSAPAQPGIYSRAAWGADESLRSRNPGCGTPSYASTVKVAFVHHTDGVNGYAAADVPSIIRGIYAYHVISEGWCDIGYNFLVDSFGRVWEGRYGGTARPVIGAHTGGFNTASTGVAMIGTYTTTTPSAALEASLARLLAWKLSLTYASPVGTAVLTSAGGVDTNYPVGYQLRLNVISGHRDADPTSCPGNAGYATLPALRRTVLADTGEGLVDPSIVFSQPTPAAAVSARFGAGLLSPSGWSFTVRSAAGAVVRVITGSGAGIAGTWDGRSSAGATLPAGVYSLTLSAGTARPYTVSVQVIRSAADVGIIGPSTGGTEQIQVLSAAASYHGFRAERVTPLTIGSPSDWTMLLGAYSAPGAEDLIAVHERNTPSGHVEVFVLSQASGYHSLVLAVVTPLALGDLSQWNLSAASLGGDGRADLFAVRTSGGASGRVEIHVLSQASSYHAFSLHAATAMAAVDSGQWRMVVGDPGGNGDLTSVRLAGAPSGRIEVHRLSATSHWNASTLAVVTPAPALGGPAIAAVRTGVGDANGDGAWDLVLTALDGTASGAVEVRALSGVTAFHTWAALRVSPLAACDPTVWTAATAH